MKLFSFQTYDLKKYKTIVPSYIRFPFAFFALFGFFVFTLSVWEKASAQNTVKAQTTTNFRLGERLTYNFSFEKFENVAYAEIYTVSQGKLGERNAVELRSKFKTVDLLSAAFYLLDETRTTFASVESGLPLYIRNTSNASVMPKETINNYLISPTTNYDLLTLIYQARNAGGIGSFQLSENEQLYNVNFTPMGNERVKTDAGEFETAISNVQSNFLTEKGITNFRINFSVDEARLPVLIRFKTAKGEFRGEIASIQMIENQTETAPTPTATPTPRPTIIPKPAATPAPYVENQPLLPELPFVLGETLQYQVANSGQRFALITVQAKERKLFREEDSLLLTATVTGTEPGNQLFNLNDTIRAQVNPDSLAPQQIELNLGSFFKPYNQTTVFDQRTGTAIFAGVNRIDIPVGTHSILSLAYAIRSFNLKPSKDPKNPVNDTRVAVFIGEKANVFTLRPSDAEIITLQGEKVSAQQISVSTGNPLIDRMNLRVWLSNDEKRVPLRLTIGTYQADLVSQTFVLPK